MSPLFQEPSHQAEQVKKPRSVTFLTIGVLTIAVFYAVRIGLAVLRWKELVQFPGISPGFIAGVSLFWAAAALGLWWGLHRRKTWAPRYTRLAAVVFSGYAWLERMIAAGLTDNGFSVLQLVDTVPVNWPFMLSITFVGILLVFWILSREHVKEIFGDIHERKP